MTATAQIPSVFSFQSANVRAFADESGEPWFNANDVCHVLGYKNPRMSVERHCREKGVTKRDTLTEKGMQESTFINEGNLYRLIIKSRKPEAEAFEREVMEVILPTIRKTGKYEATPYSVNPGDSLTKAQADILRDLLTDSIKKLPHEKQAGAMIKGWSKLKAHFGCGYRDIKQTEFTEAVSIVARHVESHLLPPSSDELARSAMKMLCAPGVRLLTTFGMRDSGEMAACAITLEQDEYIIRPVAFESVIRDSNRIPLNLLPGIINACAERLGNMARLEYREAA